MKATKAVMNPYTTTSASHVLAEAPPDPQIPQEGSWMLMNTTAVALDKKHAQLYWTWKRTNNTSFYGKPDTTQVLSSP